MNRNKKRTRRIIIISAVAVLIVGLLLGIWFYLQYRNDQKTVEVIPVNQITDYYWGDQSSSSGMVVSDYVQELFHDDNKLVSQIFVEEGQEVHIGDPLLQYDQVRLEFDVRAKKIALETADLHISTAQNQLRKLQNTRPVSTAGPTSRPTSRPGPTSTPRPSATPKPTPVPPRDVTLYSRLDLSSAPYRGAGTTENPYVFLCTKDCIVTPQFMQWLLGMEVAPTPTPSPTAEPTPDLNPDEDGEGPDFPEEEATPAPSPTPEPLTQLASPFAAVFEVRDGDSNYGQLISAFKLDGTVLSGGFQFSDLIYESNTLESIASIFNAPTPRPTATANPNNYNDMGYTSAELRKLIDEKKQEIIELQHNRKQAQLDLDKATLLLNNSTVLSNIDGVVLSLINEETAQSEGKPFLVVSGDDACYVAGAIPETLLGIVQIGDTVTIMDYMSGGSYSAEIVSISDYPLDSNSNLYYYGSQNPNSSTYEFTAVVEEGAEMQSDSYVDITLNTQDQDAADALYIQKAYVRDDDAGSYVMKAGPEDRLVKQYVQTGRILYGSSIEIKSGLTIDDYVAFPYGVDVKEGVRVVVQGSELGPIAGGGLPAESAGGDLDGGFTDGGIETGVPTDDVSIPEEGSSASEAYLDSEDGEDRNLSGEDGTAEPGRSDFTDGTYSADDGGGETFD